MKADAETDFSTIITKVVLWARLLISAYQEFTEIRWVTDPASIVFLKIPNGPNEINQ